MQKLTKIGRSAAAVLCAGGLAVAMPESAEAVPAPAKQCVSGVYRVQARCQYTPSAKLCTVVRTWVTFGTTTCGGTPRPV